MGIHSRASFEITSKTGREPIPTVRMFLQLEELMKTWGWKYADYMMTYAVKADTETAAREAIRKRLGVRRLPPGLKVWDASVKPIPVWVVREPLAFA